MTKPSRTWRWGLARRASGTLISIVAMTIMPAWTQGQGSLDPETGWDRAAAARYLDARIDLWFERATELKTGEGKTTCISCHTVVPYLLVRPVLRKAMHVKEPTAQEARLLKEMSQRIQTYSDHESMSDAKHQGERATEAVLNALIMARQDSFSKRTHLSPVAEKAFEQLWETQGADGAWDWMNFGEEPDETADAKYQGAALAAIAIGTAPGLLERQDVVSYVDKLLRYLNGKFGEQNLYRRTWMLVASGRLNGLLTREGRESVVADLRAKQNGDGGWSLSKLGPWRWSGESGPFAPPGKPDLSLLERSDGYATGLVVYALRESGLSRSDETLRRAFEWLKTSQVEVPVEQHGLKGWRTYSLNHDREHGGSRGGAWKQLLMSDAATAFAVLALSPAE